MKKLDKDPDLALFDGDLQGLVALCFENERPLLGLAGLLDWRFHGEYSGFLKKGAFRGSVGEKIYLPYQGPDRVYHILLIGAGQSPQPGERTKAKAAVVKNAAKALTELKIDKMGISNSDFGFLPADDLDEPFGELDVWLAH